MQSIVGIIKLLYKPPSYSLMIHCRSSTSTTHHLTGGRQLLAAKCKRPRYCWDSPGNPFVNLTLPTVFVPVLKWTSLFLLSSG